MKAGLKKRIGRLEEEAMKRWIQSLSNEELLEEVKLLTQHYAITHGVTYEEADHIFWHQGEANRA